MFSAILVQTIIFSIAHTNCKAAVFILHIFGTDGYLQQTSFNALLYKGNVHHELFKIIFLEGVYNASVLKLMK